MNGDAWRVVLVSPLTAENVGAAARVMKNFGLHDLVLVDPRCNIAEDEKAGHLARFASDVLDARREVPTLDEALADCHAAFALTRHQSYDRPLDYEGFAPAALVESFGGNDRRIALVFGREDHGMTNEECSRCSARWAIPTSADGPSLNLAQAVAIALAGIAQVADRMDTVEATDTDDSAASIDEVDGLLDHIAQVMEASRYERGVPMDHPLRLMRRAALRGRLTSSEVRAFRGVCRRVLNAILGFERRP